MRDLIDREAALACFHDWVDKHGDIHTADEMPEYQRIEALPSVGGWIPCEKGEPNEDMECWVTVKTTDALYRGNFTKRYGERRDKGFITSGGFMWWNTALAWMPIYEPEPYHPEGEE